MTVNVVEPRLLYLCGPMTGLPGYNYDAFFQAEHQLREAGYMVANPARIEGSHEHWTWEMWMREGLKALLLCEALAVLPDWQESKGAGLETSLAHDLKMPVEDVEVWLAARSQ